MTQNLVDIFDELRAQPAVPQLTEDNLGIADWDLRSRTLEAFIASVDSQGQENVEKFRAFRSKYDSAVAELRQVWGEPNYEGPGWRDGHKADCPSPDDWFWQLYSKALRICWWEREGFVYAVMITGHDANTLEKLRLAVAEKSTGG